VLLRTAQRFTREMIGSTESSPEFLGRRASGTNKNGCVQKSFATCSVSDGSRTTQHRRWTACAQATLFLPQEMHKDCTNEVTRKGQEIRRQYKRRYDGDVEGINRSLHAYQCRSRQLSASPDRHDAAQLTASMEWPHVCYDRARQQEDAPIPKLSLPTNAAAKHSE
jgi:hypothetical protein